MERISQHSNYKQILKQNYENPNPNWFKCAKFITTPKTLNPKAKHLPRRWWLTGKLKSNEQIVTLITHMYSTRNIPQYNVIQIVELVQSSITDLNDVTEND